MTDLEIVKACADAMGLRLLTEANPHKSWHGLMFSNSNPSVLFIESGGYDPLHDDAQCFALVKKYPHICLPAMTHAMFDSCDDIGPNAKPIDFNRVICVRVAHLTPGSK